MLRFFVCGNFGIHQWEAKQRAAIWWWSSTITINFSKVKPLILFYLLLFDAHQRSADTFCMLRGSFAVLEDASLIGLSHAILESHQYKCPASHRDNPKTSLWCGRRGLRAHQERLIWRDNFSAQIKIQLQIQIQIKMWQKGAQGTSREADMERWLLSTNTNGKENTEERKMDL